MCQSQAVSQELEQGPSNEARGRDLNGERLFCLVTGLGRIEAVREQLVGSQVGHRVTVAAGCRALQALLFWRVWSCFWDLRSGRSGRSPTSRKQPRGQGPGSFLTEAQASRSGQLNPTWIPAPACV